jgi:hypothetical protein
MSSFLKIVGLLLPCALAAHAHADTLVLTPVTAGQYYSGFSGTPYAHGEDPSMTPAATTVDVSCRGTIISASAYRKYAAVMEYSLAALPPQAVITSATVSFQVTGYSLGALYNFYNPPSYEPSLLQLYIFDGADGQVSLQDMNQVSILEATRTPALGMNDFTLTKLSALNDRPGNFVGFSLFDNRYPGDATSTTISFATSAPTLAITYEVPEPASAALLVAASGLLLRRPRTGRTRRV